MARLPAFAIIPRVSRAILLLACAALLIASAVSAPHAQAQTTLSPAAAGPKAYIGLFGDNAVAVVDTATNRLLRTIPVPAGPHGLVITPDGRTVYVSSDGASTVSVIDATTDQVVSSIEVGQAPHGLAITPDGRRVLAAVFGADRVVTIDTATNRVIAQASVPGPHNIAISPGGTAAYVAAQQQGNTALVVLDLTGANEPGRVALEKTPRALSFSPDGARLYFTLAGLDAVQVLDPVRNEVTAQIPVGASPHHPLFTANGEYGLVVSQGPGELAIIAPATNSVVGTVSVGMMPHWIAMSGDGETAYVTNEGSGDISVVDLDMQTVSATIPVGEGPRKIVVQPAPVAGGTAAAPADETDAAVAIHGFAFMPDVVTVARGHTVVWTNQDPTAHTVTSSDGSWDSGELRPGAGFRHTFDSPGTYAYACSIHPFMRGTVVVDG